MAELIDKRALIDKFEEVKWKCDNLKDVAEITGVQAVIDAMPTTTEYEIRASAIDEFAEKIIRYVDCGHLCNPTEIRWSDLSVVEMVKRLAEQLKEE